MNGSASDCEIFTTTASMWNSKYTSFNLPAKKKPRYVFLITTENISDPTSITVAYTACVTWDAEIFTYADTSSYRFGMRYGGYPKYSSSKGTVSSSIPYPMNSSVAILIY